ncbi:MAG: methyl-accepting chemotaxis protein [Pseudomonadota bacterium]
MASVASELKIPGLPEAVEGQSSKGKSGKKSKEGGAGGASSAAAKEKRAGEFHGLPIIGQLAFQRQLQVLGILVLMFLSMTVATFGLTIWQGRVNQVQTTTATELKMLSQRLAILAEQSVRGQKEAFEKLNAGQTAYASSVAALRDGSEMYGVNLTVPSDAAGAALAVVTEKWKPFSENIGIILKQQDGLVALQAREAAIRKAGPQMRTLSQQLGVVTQERGEDPRAVAIARQLYADVANYDFMEANRLLSTDDPNPQVALGLARNAAAFEQAVSAVANGSKDFGLEPVRHPASKATAAALLKLSGEFRENVKSVVDAMNDLAKAKQASREISLASEPLLGSVDGLTAVYQEEGAGFGGIVTGLVFAVLTLAVLALIAKAFVDDARRRAMENERANRRNEEAILRLLDDMSQLAEGDLTRHARVTEDMTGAIADAVNFAIDELRSLVNQINQAAGQLTESTNQGRAVSGQLLQVAERQGEEIKTTTSSVLQMADSITGVSNNAAECAQVAEQSLAASQKGAMAVNESIAGMDALREQIQETSKRIKRLGESSQEIGEIVQLIASITEQTNVLALNAAIQAAAAGDAGRGFTVVAEEVQRLAERSAEATKQIGAIVRTIQSDTHDAVQAMEQSTIGVVEGAKRADGAGQALAEIRDVTTRLAELISSISESAQAQRESAQAVAKSMQGILNITQQTTKGTKWTAESMGQVNELAQKLKVSVSGFKA